MGITEHGKAALQSGTEAMEGASDRVQRAAGRLADRTGDVADRAWRSARHASREVGGFVRERPVETALIGAGAACLIAAVAFWLSRRD